MKWTLKWCGMKDTPMIRACIDYITKTFPIVNDSQAHLVDHAEYSRMIKDGEIEPGPSYWSVGEGQLGMVVLTEYTKFSTTWDKVSSAKTDFEAGWRACK